MANTKEKLICCCCVVSVVTLVILGFLSVSSVEVNEYALRYSTISKSIDKKIYTAGIHFIMVGHSFIRFPKNVQTIEFSTSSTANGQALQSRTKDGLEVSIVVSFQYKILQNQTYDLYMKYGKDYEKIYVTSAIDYLTDQCTQYNASMFFMDRALIADNMTKGLGQLFEKDLNSAIQFFQLRSVDLPDKFEQAIQQTQVSKQMITKAYAQMNQTIIQLQTQVIQAEFAAQSTINIAQGNAQSIVIDSVAKAASFKKVQNAQSKSYANLQSTLGMSQPELLHFIKSKMVRDRNTGQMVVNLDTPEND